MEATEHPHPIHVTVTFALATGPYRHDYPRDTTAQTVLTDAMAAFSVASDGTDRFFLSHDGQEVPLDQTLDELAGHAEALHLALRTETTSG
jgi:hypothetical protein